MASRHKSWKRWEGKQQQSSSQRISDESDSSSEIEDDDAEGVTPQIEKDFLKTLSFVKSKDPRIYEKQNKFYESGDDSSSEAESKDTVKEKAMYLRDYERKIILEKGGQYSEDESDDDRGRDSDEEREKREASPTYVEEQKQIRDSFRAAFESDESESEEGLLQTKTKTKQEKEEEESDYKKWLKGETEELPEGKDMGALRTYWTDPKLDEDEKFLRNFILNKEYINKDADEESSSESEEEDEEEARISEDERILEEQDNFERKFNFRFEEPDTDFIKRYPRTVSGSVRRKDASRTEKRKEKKERKGEEKERKRDELKHIKNVKKQEIMDKLEQLRQATGNATVGFNPDDIEEDFDPEKYDKMMQNIFNEDYEAQADDGMKPDIGDEYDEENYGAWDEEEEYGDEEDYGEGDYEEDETYEPHCDDPDFIMDADYDPSVSKKSGKDKGESSKKKKRKNAGFADAVKIEKPNFDPTDKTFDEYMEEYYKLDYEDLIGDLPCRFKYRGVMPNDFGLSVEEVLAAKDKELNQWVSVKKTSQYRTKEEEIYDIKMFKKRSKNEQLKKRIFLSLMEEEKSEDEDQDEDTTGNEGTKPQEDSTTVSQKGHATKDVGMTSPEGKKKRRKKKKRREEDGSSPNKDIATPDKETTSANKGVVSPNKDDDDVLSSSQMDESMEQEVDETESKNMSRKQKKRKCKQSNLEESTSPNKEVVSSNKDIASPSKENKSSNKEVASPNKEVASPNKDIADMKRTVAHSDSEDEDQELHRREKQEVHVESLPASAQSGKVKAPLKRKSIPTPVHAGTGKSPSHGGGNRQDNQSKHKKGPTWSSGGGSSKSHSQGASNKQGQFSLTSFKKGNQSLRQKQQISSSQNQAVSMYKKQQTESPGNDGGGGRKRRKKRKSAGGRGNADPINAISDARLKAYGVNPKKIKYQLEYQKQKQNKS